MSGYPMRVIELLSGESQQFDRNFGGAMCLASAAVAATTVINTGPCILYGYIIHTATGVALITVEDGIAAGGVKKITIPIGKGVGEYVLSAGILCPTGLYLNFAASATGSVSVLYLPAA